MKKTIWMWNYYLNQFKQKLKRFGKKIKNLFKKRPKVKRHKPKDKKIRWINFGNKIIRYDDLINLEFTGIQLDEFEFKPIATITYLEGNEIIDKDIAFESVAEFNDFRNKIIKDLDALDYRWSDGVDADYVKTEEI